VVDGVAGLVAERGKSMKLICVCLGPAASHKLFLLSFNQSIQLISLID